MIKKDIIVNYSDYPVSIKEISKNYLFYKDNLDFIEEQIKDFENSVIELTISIKDLIDLYFCFISASNNEFDSVANVQAIKILKNIFKCIGISNFENYNKDFEDEDTIIYLSNNDIFTFYVSLKITLDLFLRNNNYNYVSLLRNMEILIEENDYFINYINLTKGKEYYSSYVSSLLNIKIFDDNNSFFFSIDNSIYSFDQDINLDDYDLSKEDIKYLEDNLKYRYKLIELKSKDDIPLLMVMKERIRNMFNGNIDDESMFKIINQFSKLELIKDLKTKKHNLDFLYNDKVKLSDQELEEIKNEKHSLVERMEIRILTNNDIDKVYKSLRTKNQKEAFIQAYYNLMHVHNLHNYLEYEEIMNKDLPFSTIPEVNIGVLKLSNNNGLPILRN